MSEAQRLRGEVEAAAAGDPWHGPPLLALLDGVGRDEAFQHPIEGAHSIWEIVLHMTAWTREVTRRLEGGSPQVPPEGDWPSAGAGDAAAWERAKQALIEAHIHLAAVLRALAPGELDVPVGEGRVPAIGTGVTRHVMVSGLLQHGAYHGGQIALLRKAASPQPSRVVIERSRCGPPFYPPTP